LVTFCGEVSIVVQGLVRVVGRRLAVVGAALSLVTGMVAWTASQPAFSVALASSCSSRSDDRCESKADRAEDAKEAQNAKQCRANHTEKFCSDQDRAEDKAEKDKDRDCEQQEDREGDHDGKSDCETYGGSGDSNVQIGALASLTKPISAAGFDAGLVGTGGSILVVAGTVLMVAVRRRRIARKYRIARK
jgi:hypothetical protein